MTDQVTPLSDEELSAHLDGESGPEVGERIAAEPEARSRMASLAAAARAIAAEPVTPLPPATVDNIVAQALAAATEVERGAGGAADAKGVSDGRPPAPLPASGGSGDETGVAPLAPSRSGRGRAAPPAWLVAAVVLLVFAVGAGLVIAGRNGGRQDAAAPTTSKSAASDGAADRSPSATGGAESNQDQGSASAGSPSPDESPTLVPGHGAPAPDPSTTVTGSFAVPAPLWLGLFSTPDALRTELATTFPAQPQPSPETPPTAASIGRCADQVGVTLALKGKPLHQGYASVAGTMVLVYEFASTSFRNKQPTTLVAAVGAASCDPVVTFER